jgi:polysaccharide deacetylase 2 family uncharacterized protein YibQ
LKSETASSAWSRVRTLPLFSLVLGFSIALLIISGFVLNSGPAPYRGEPVLRLSLEMAEKPTVSTEVPRESALDLRPSIDGNAVTAPTVLGTPSQSSSQIIIREANAAPSAASLSRVPAPLSELLQSSSVGMLPTISATGLKPMQAYAKPSSAAIGSGAPARIALVVGGLGLNSSLTAEAMRILPAEVTLAFAPYGSNLEYWTEKARSEGHEYLLQLPLEPFDYPDNDPGPHTLLTSLRSGENLQRMRWLMSRISGYAGVTNHMGAKFTASEPHALGMMKELQERGLLYVDDGNSARSMAPELAKSLGHPSVQADVIIDADPKPEEIGRALAQLEALAQERGYAVGSASIFPITLSNLSNWVEQLQSRGIVLVPVSSIVLNNERR